MQRKIFLGIEVPQQVKKRLSQKIKKWENLPVRWSEEENLHVTLAFLGYVDDELLPEICNRVEETVRRFEIFDIEINRIELGSNEKIIWASGESSEQLKKLHEDISKNLGLTNVDRKVFKPHITLGRVKKLKWDELKEKTKIKEDIKIFVPVENVQVIESEVEKGRRKFTPIQVCPLEF